MPSSPPSSSSSSVLLLSVGSRGDAEPIVSLASSLFLAASSQTSPVFSKVHLCLAADYANLLSSTTPITSSSSSSSSSTCQLHVHTPSQLTLSAMKDAMIKYITSSSSPLHNNKNNDDDPIPLQVAAMGAITTHCVVPIIPFLHQLIREHNVSVLVTTTLGVMAARALLDVCPHLRVFAVHFQPNVFTDRFPCYLSSAADAMTAAEVLACAVRAEEDDMLCSETENNNSQLLSGQIQDTEPQRYLASHQALVTFFRAALPDLNAMRDTLLLEQQQQSFLPPLSELDAQRILSGLHPRVTNVLSLLCPPALDVAARLPPSLSSVRIVPPLADTYIPGGWTPDTACPAVVDFLHRMQARGMGRPVVLSTGSMSVGSPATAATETEREKARLEVVRMLVRGVREAFNSRRACILLAGSANLRMTDDSSSTTLTTEGNENDHCHKADNDVEKNNDLDNMSLQQWCANFLCQVPAHVDVQFAWLFPHCHAVLCHGGAGVTAAALAAGVPPVVAPLVCDQFFWARVVEAAGIGAFVRPSLLRTREEEVCRALRVTENDRVRARVKRYAAARKQAATSDVDKDMDKNKEKDKDDDERGWGAKDLVWLVEDAAITA